jgi:hypothetical protein
LSETAQVVAEFEDGGPAIVVNRYGQGWAVFVGSLVSLGFYRFQDENAGKLLKGLVRLAGIEPPVRADGVPKELDIEPRVLEGVGENGQPFRIFFAFNHTEQPRQPQFGIAMPPGSYLATDLFTGQVVPHQYEGGRL